ncbi:MULTISPECIES: hypothetical protein [Vibrio]|jgi:hypothetical protein|uniref:hypothetical protein n=1 Tax=Vibrio TaxID=662 RepID=UPI001F10C2BA|nr:MULTISPECIES: hypothetical protein [unclassified Vibrio]
MNKAQISLNKNTLLGVFEQFLILALWLLVGSVVWSVWFMWGINVVPFDDPYLSDTEYQRLIKQETQLINIGLWVGKLYTACAVMFFIVRVRKVLRASSDG